jgi:benzylsuccinate CoA-transferase BbsE subunit
MTQQEKEGMLSPFRVLDLTDEKGLICGKLFGDLGADVIKIEKPGGDSARNIGPFWHDEPGPEKSLYWFAMNANKRGITLDIDTTSGREIFKKLVVTADFVIESFKPGYLNKRELGYRDLEKINPGIILVSITPFGQTGPYKNYKAPDIVAWAAGAGLFMRTFGDVDRPPFRISHHPQTYYHAGTEAVVGALVALYYRQTSGVGQHVDVSIQECMAFNTGWEWDLNKVERKRGETLIPVVVRHMWPCKDGWVMWRYTGGPMAERYSVPLIKWMADEGMADDFMRNFDWKNFSHYATNQDIINRLEEQTIKFFMTHTKAEMMAGAIKYRIMLYPIATTKDIVESPQLAARDFWQEVKHPELDTSITYPAKWANSSELPPGISRRAPLIGEHNQEIYEKELGFSRENIIQLKQAGVI